MTARHFDPMTAIAAKVTLAEIGQLFSTGKLHEGKIRTSGIYVDRPFEGTLEKRIEKRNLCVAETA